MEIAAIYSKAGMTLSIMLMLSAGFPVHGAEAVIPLSIPFDWLSMGMTRELTTMPEDTIVMQYKSGCSQLSLDRPQFDRQQEFVRFVSHGAGSTGIEMFGTCLNPVDWRGYVEVLAVPSITPDWRLHFKIDHSNLYDEAWQKGLLTGPIWDIAQDFVLPSLSGFTVDLSPPRNDALSLLKDFAPPSSIMQLDAIFRSAKVKAVRLDDHGVNVDMSIMLPDSVQRRSLVRSVPAAPLNPEELETVRKALEQWDAFIVFVVKDIGKAVADADIRAQLFDLLLTGRYQVLPILAGEGDSMPGDPVRVLFIETWSRLQTIIMTAEERGIELNNALRYAAFIRAGNILHAIDRAAPGLGLEISADGLRRLARILQPELTTDPLIYSQEPDPELRELFGFPASLPEHGPLEPVPEDTGPLSSFPGIIKNADAGESSRRLDLSELKRRLKRWAPKDSEYQEYGPIMNQLLLLTSDRELKSSGLKGRHRPVFRNLMRATALKESCWRQFVLKSSKVTYVRSSAGSIGLMQINPHVWRGFYKLEQLKWNTHYNAEAGAEILLHYWRSYAVKEEKAGSIDHIARSAYSIYNAGPGAIARYRKKSSTPREKKVDNRFWEIYRGFKADKPVDLFRCTVG
ncbi:MAG: lytic transglycosylase domain-containing protein [Gammaproteobacteria bacterium]